MKTTTLLYVAKAEDNFAISLEIGERTPGHRGWQATVLFYAALFWIRAYFEEFGILDKPSHFRRMALVEATDAIAVIAEDFARLQDISEDARYNLPEMQETTLADARASYARIQAHLERLIRPVGSLEDYDDFSAELLGGLTDG